MLQAELIESYVHLCGIVSFKYHIGSHKKIIHPIPKKKIGATRVRFKLVQELSEFALYRDVGCNNFELINRSEMHRIK